MTMPKKKFVQTMDHMLARTPKEHIKGTVVVDQVYAHYQHANPHLFHPDGGEPFFLTTPLYVNVKRYMAELAKGATQERLQTVMRDIVEDLSREVYERAPLEFGDLKASGHPMVERDGRLVYDRQPNVPRLSKDDLRIKSELRQLFDPDRYSR